MTSTAYLDGYRDGYTQRLREQNSARYHQHRRLGFNQASLDTDQNYQEDPVTDERDDVWWIGYCHGRRDTRQHHPPNLRLLATTATANERVMDDLRIVLGPDLTVSRGDLNRPSLALQTIQLRSQAERLAWLAEQIPRMPGNGIIYTLTVRDAEQVANWLLSRGVVVASYTGESGEQRPELEQDLMENASRLWLQLRLWAWGSTSRTSRS